jgi:hypothetical protein
MSAADGACFVRADDRTVARPPGSAVSKALCCLLALLALGLNACGGSGEGANPAGTATAPPQSAAEATSAETAAHTEASPSTSSIGAPHRQPPGPPPSSSTPASGDAGSFVEPHADNSIPTFGHEAGSGEREAAAVAIGTYLRARAAGDWSTACAGLAASARKEIETLGGSAAAADSCPQAYSAFSAGFPASARADPLGDGLLALRVKGPTGFALFYGPAGASEKYMLPIRREAGAWKLTQLEALAYPPGGQSG